MLLQARRWTWCVIFVALECSCSYLFAAESFQISPLPLAQNAKPKPDESPTAAAKQKRDRIYVRANVLLGEHKFDDLEQIADDYWLLYRAGKVSADDYLDAVYQLVPYKAGKTMLADVLAWTREHPKSYIAWQVLGALYRDIAWQERGNGWAKDTSQAQFQAMGEYAKLSYAALRKSLSLSPRPLASYSQLVSVLAILPRDDEQVAAGIKGRVENQLAAIAHAKVEVAGNCAWAKPFSDAARPVWNEQLGYLCQAWLIDPNATRVFKRLVGYNLPRWGGSYVPLEGLFNVLSKEPKLGAPARGEMLAYLLEEEADDMVDRDPHAAAELYERAFDASPTQEKVGLLYKAAYTERDKAKDSTRAMALWKKIVAVRPEEHTAIFEIGFVYESRGDLKGYIEQMIKAANLGMLEAQNNVGYFYMVGQRGLPRDLLQARAWLTLSANQGFEHARQKLKLLDDMIAKEQPR